MPFALTAALAIGSGIANIFSGQAAAAHQERLRKESQKILERSIIDDAELGRMLRSQSRLFNAQLQNTINTTAIRSSGIANRGVVGAAAAGQVKAAEGVALANTEQQVSARNVAIKDRIAMMNVYLGSEFSDPVGDFFSGATSGTITGSLLSRQLGLLNETEIDDDLIPGIEGQDTQGVGDDLAQVQSPFDPRRVANFNIG